MQIQQITKGQDTKLIGNLSTSTVEKPVETEKSEFTLPISTTKEMEGTMAAVAQKAKSMTEQKTSNHAEYIAGTMNEDIYEKGKDEGLDLSKEDEEAIVTVVDKIQLEMIQGGNEAVMATADLSLDKLESISPGAAVAYEMAQKLVTPTPQEVSYLVDNELEPTVGNLYQAQNVTKFAEVTENGKGLGKEIQEQIKSRLEEFGIETTKENIETASYMVEHGVELTREKFNLFSALENVSLPMEETETLLAIQDAITFGRGAVGAMVLPEYSWQQRAIRGEEILQNVSEEDLYYIEKEGMKLSLENLEIASSADKTEENKDVTKQLEITRARKIIVEARLYMSASANLSMLRRGIHLETEGLEKLVEELKEKEHNLTSILLGEFDQVRETKEALQEVKEAPAHILYQIEMTQTFTEVREIAISQTTASRDDYAKANGAYETMQTQVRSDLGDSIQKAFRNVDDILRDMDLETSGSNQRAVRILAYNQTEITVENINQIKTKDEQMQSIFQKMNPEVVLSMIREGFNPLDATMEELNTKINEIQEKTDPNGVEKYSKFLVRLEQQNEITQQEKESFIGIYRLLRQVEKTDGAAVGAVLLSGGEVTMRNLMTQVRSHKNANLDIKVDDSMGMLSQETVVDLSITQQIEASYQAACVKNALDELQPQKLKTVESRGADIEDMTPEELLEALRSEAPEDGSNEAEVKEVRQAFKLLQNNQELEQFFTQFEVTKTPENILAIADYLKDKNRVYKDLFEKHNSLKEKLDTIANIKEDIWENFSEQIKSPEDMAKAQQELADLAENVMEGMMESEETTSIDLKGLQTTCRQLSILGDMGKKEEYAVPVLVQDEMGCVNLKIVRGEEEKGKVAITTEIQGLGKIAAEFSVTKNSIKGYVVSDDEDTKEKMEGYNEFLKSGISQEGEAFDCVYVTSKQLSLEKFYQKIVSSQEGSNTEVQTRKLYTVARSFVQTLSKLNLE